MKFDNIELDQRLAFHFEIREALVFEFFPHDVNGAYSGRGKTDLNCHLQFSLKKTFRALYRVNSAARYLCEHHSLQK